MRLIIAAAVVMSVLGCDCEEEPGGGTGGGAGGGAGGAQLSGTVSVFQGASARGAALDPRLRREVLAQLTPRARAPGGRVAQATQRLPALAVGQLRGARQEPRLVAGDVIVGFAEYLEPKAALARLAVEGLEATHVAYASTRLQLLHFRKPGGAALNEGETRELVARLAERPGVRFTEPNGVRQALVAPNDPLFPAMWHLPQLQLPAAWDVERGTTSAVTVAVLDTGIIPHPDLQPRLVAGYDMVVDPANAGDGDGRDADPTDPGGDLPNGQSSWHGTHCAGTIGAGTDNGVGIAGVNWQARVQPVRVLGRQGGTDFDIAAGMTWASGGAVPGLPANATPAQVVNLSLGGPGAPLQAYQDAIDDAARRNVVFVVAAGNDDVDASGFTPCNQQGVLCVGATRFNGKRASYSNFGARVDVMAPGGEVAEDLNGDGYPDGVLSTFRDSSTGQAAFSFENGTSMAAPHVAGVVSLLKARVPGLTFTQARQALVDTANPASRCDEGCGTGLVNAHAALLRVTGSQPTGPGRLSLGTSELFFSSGAAPQVLQLANVGGQPLTVTLSPGGAEGGRLFVQGSVTLAAGATASVSVGAELAGLAAGVTANATLTLTSSGGNATVTVKLRAGGAGGGPVAVALIFQNAREEWVVAEAVEALAASGFGWSMTAPPGRYFLFAVQDTNNNGDYDDGEPLGLYPNMDSPRELQVAAGQRLSGLTFAVVPSTNISGTEGSQVGTACTGDGQCGDGICGTGFPGGYCTRDCSAATCPLGSKCVSGEGYALCLATCPGPRLGRSACRAGYVCEDDASGAGLCIPACGGDVDCAPGTCDLASGYCR